MEKTLGLKRRHKYEFLRTQMEFERSTFEASWREVSEYILPRRVRFFVSDANKGDRRNQKIIDSTATLSARTGRAGMMGGITSPARQWFKLGLSNVDLSESGPAKVWLDDQTRKMSNVFSRSNLYTVLPVLYGDLMVFGTGCILMEPDAERVVRFYPMPIGSFSIGQNASLQVDKFSREFRMTVAQVVEKFGYNPEKREIDWENISESVQSQYINQNYEAWVDICHVICPNEDYDPNKLDPKYKRFTSVYYEKGTTSTGGSNGLSSSPGIDHNKFLRHSGFDFFPVLAPRWQVTGEDVYGTDCPGITAIGDIKQLQIGEKRVAQAVEKMINPPLAGPNSLRNSKVSLLPGDITYLDPRDAASKLQPIHQVDFRVDIMEAKQEQVRQRIKKSFFEDLFLQLSQSDRRQITAREIEERHEEKILALGPVLEQLNQDLLDPLIENTFNLMLAAGRVDQPPKEIAGQEIKVEYTSIMAEAQKLVGLSGIERFTGFVSELAGVDPSALDKLNIDEMVDIYGDFTSVPAAIIRSDDEVEAIRSARQQASQQTQQLDALRNVTGTAKELSETDLSGENALTALTGG